MIGQSLLRYVSAVLYTLAAAASLAAEESLSTVDRARLLERHVPILIVSQEPGSSLRDYPLDLRWWVTKCEIHEAERKPKVVDSLSVLLKEHAERTATGAQSKHMVLSVPEGLEREFIQRGHYRRGDARPASPPTVYGAVLSSERSTYRLLYCFFFGRSIQERSSQGASTEGDWIAVDFDVDYSNPEQPRFIKAIYHNHGRQIFVDDPQENLELDRLRPMVYLEDTTHEPWPVSGESYGDTKGDGFALLDRMPEWLWTNNLRDAKDARTEGHHVPNGIGWELIEKYSSRGHNGKHRIVPQRVVDITEPGTSDESTLVHVFEGRWGKPIGDIARPPRSPRHTPAIWDRSFATGEDGRGRR